VSVARTRISRLISDNAESARIGAGRHPPTGSNQSVDHEQHPDILAIFASALGNGRPSSYDSMNYDPMFIDEWLGVVCRRSIS
jgi:hypothetical protein